MSGELGRAHDAETLFLVDALNMVEALGNLNHLIAVDNGDDSDAVQSYLSQSDDILRRLVALLRSRYANTR